MNGIDSVDPTLWFTSTRERGGALSTRHTGGFMNVTLGEGRTDMRKNFWSQRVVEPWNNLPDGVKQVETLDSFKNCIDNLSKRQNNHL